MDATTIRVREPRELLALLPYQLGFRPERSAVAVALRPPRGRVGLIARVDLPDLADDDFGPQLARRLVTHLVGDGAARAVLVVYADADPRRPSGGDLAVAASLSRVTPREPPGCVDPSEAARAAHAVRHFRDAAGPFLGDVQVWVVTPDGYLSFDCTDPVCCPPGGRPLRDLQATEVGAHMVLAGAMVADSRETLVPDTPAGGPARRNATRAADRWRVRRAEAALAGPPWVALWRSSGLRAWRTEVAAAMAGDVAARPAVLGRLNASLGDVVLRDAVLMTLIPGSAGLPEASLGDAGPTASTGEVAGTEIASALSAIVGPDGGVPPDPDIDAAASSVLERLVSHASSADRAPALTLLGLLAWWRGDGARAGVLLERALRADPGHRLAHLLMDALAAGLAPGWVRAGR